MKYEHVVFDLDGTLIDSRADLADAVNHVRGTFGLPALPLHVVTSYIGAGAKMLVQRGLGPAHVHLLDEGLKRFMEYYGEHLLDHTRLHLGIAEVLSALRRRGVTLSVLSNKPEAMSRTILNGCGVLALFVTVIGGDSLPVRKPDPAGLRYICHLTGLSPRQILLVGDSAIDLDTARAAGAGFCGVTWGFGLAGLHAAGVEEMISEATQLLPIVGPY